MHIVASLDCRLDLGAHTVGSRLAATPVYDVLAAKSAPAFRAATLRLHASQVSSCHSPFLVVPSLGVSLILLAGAGVHRARILATPLR